MHPEHPGRCRLQLLLLQLICFLRHPPFFVTALLLATPLCAAQSSPRTFHIDAALRFLRLHGRDWTAALTMDHNVWSQPTGPLILWATDKIDAALFPAFMKPRKFDAHSLVTDPQFLNPAQSDYRLAPNSPARQITPTPGALP